MQHTPSLLGDQHADDLNLDYIKKNVKFSLQGTIPMNGEERKREREREGCGDRFQIITSGGPYPTNAIPIICMPV